MSPKGLGPEKDYAGEGQQHIQKTDQSFHQRGHPTKTRPLTVKDRQSHGDFDFDLTSNSFVRQTSFKAVQGVSSDSSQRKRRRSRSSKKWSES
jgi:hypothetical protein